MGLIEKVISSKAKIRILRIFADNIKGEFLLSDIARMLKTSTGTVHPALTSLVSSRILISKKLGASTIYRVNYENPLVRKLFEIFHAELDLMFKKAKEFVRKLNKRNIKSIILFGSVARKQSTELSDIDLLTIYRKDEKQIKNRVLVLSEKFLEQDMFISSVFLSEEEVKRMLKRLDSFILNVQSEGITLFGKGLEEL